ncbi:MULTISPECIES: urea ABC transporter permease subunit UrtB [Giesbergeria]|uniref:Urea ABC transporter permease subunit UrtB n=1 Tax=Giesbergeria sinuosa TaxID=80883 RepID=A0ABV9Q9G6_9BURK
MMSVLRRTVLGLGLACGALLPLSASALTADQALQLVEGEADERVAQLLQLAASDDPRAHALIRALSEESVQVQEGRVLIVQGTQALDAVSGVAVPLGDLAEEAVVNNRLRGALDSALAGMDLLEGDSTRQAQAAAILQRGAFDDPNPAQLLLVERALSAEFANKLDPAARESLLLAQAALHLASADPTQRIAAAQKLAHTGQPIVKALLAQRLSAEANPTVKAALSQALRTVENQLDTAAALGQMFTGISLGSILLLAALGLAITYGLMGVINMAHGELIMIGAYATYLVQVAFRQYLPNAFDWYLLAALPLSFLAAALVGAAMERSVIRFLYGRPLETLLATWGISLVLMQGVRSLFGAQNVGVENPAWMSGGITLLGSLTLPWNRIVIVAFALAVLLAVALLIGKTRLGLFVRAVTQNRPIASCMGVNTARIDTYAFALGSGIAGLAGCALSQVGNVGPDLGQNYIVDSFMVVVLGGVGQLAGTVYAALGLGLLNKLLEGWVGAVLAKIAVLVFIIVFIQKRPQGIFALKGRQA